MLISDLPDFPAIQQVKDALWGRGTTRGAAVMVGAGFSRLATLSDMSSALPPLWSDFSNRMKNQLYPNECGPSDPLRLAQEYKAALGEPALDGLIRSLVQDEKWEPGNLHETLLSLPWSDVLTTNWDTLLERKQPLDTERTYDVVLTIDDIARTRAPRIVKLHGSLPDRKPFIFTEEDYRTYPKKFAPFVNLAQQVLLENELCLIGFSGNDPNFMQWAGWVRDNLGNASRQIRLIGVLDLSPSLREMLKQQNVTPIDLTPLVAELPNDAQNRKATSMFLNWLVTSKPADAHAWIGPSQTYLQNSASRDVADLSLEEVTSAWRKDRLNHPGWLVTPGGMQQSIRLATDSHYPIQSRLTEATDINKKMRLLFELAFRHEVAFWPLTEPYARIIQETYSSGGKKSLSLHEGIQLCAFLFAEARRRRDWDSFDFWATQLEGIDDPEASAELYYGKALRSKQDLAYGSLEDLVPKILGNDPVWKMRQGMLYTFLLDDAKAAICFQMARNDVRARRAKDRQSIWLLSREAWAAWVHQWAQAELPETGGKNNSNNNDFNDWPSRYGRKKCDPWDYMSFVDRKTTEEFDQYLSKKVTVTPLFNAGYFRPKAINIPIAQRGSVTAFDLLMRIQEVAGVPSRIGQVNILSNRLERALEIKSHDTERDVFAAAGFLSNTEKGLMASTFNRFEIAKIPRSSIVELAVALRGATDYLLTKSGDINRSKCIDQICCNIELISRLSVRMSAEEARLYYNWAMALCTNVAVNHWLFYRPIDNVLKRCLEAMPREQKMELVETAFFLPLPGERDAGGPKDDWPELIGEFEFDNSDRPRSSLEWDLRISQLIIAVHNGTELDRDRAIQRLHALYKADSLANDEKNKLAKAIWSRTSTESGWPSTRFLSAFVFLELPETVPGRAKDLFYSTCIKTMSKGNIDRDLLHTVRGGLKSSVDILNDAKKYFCDILWTCVNWRPGSTPIDFMVEQVESQNDQVKQAIVVLLGDTLLPEMSVEDLTDNVKNAWYGQLVDPNDRFMVATAFEYSRLFPESVADMVGIIRKTIYCRDRKKIAFGYYAIQRFIDAMAQGVGEVPPILISDVISICESIRDPGLVDSLNTAIKLVDAGLLFKGDLQRLAETVEVVWSEYSYSAKFVKDEQMIILTLVRSECAKLANALKRTDLGSGAVDIVCKEAARDPIPEVRYSV